MIEFYDPRTCLESKIELLCVGTFHGGCGGQSQQQDLTEEEEEEGLHVVLFSQRNNKELI